MSPPATVAGAAHADVASDGFVFDDQIAPGDDGDVVEVAGADIAMGLGAGALARRHAAGEIEVATGLELGALDQSAHGDGVGGRDLELIAHALVDDDRAGEVDVPGGEVDVTIDDQLARDAQQRLAPIEDAVGRGHERAVGPAHDRLIDADLARGRLARGHGLAGDVPAVLAHGGGDDASDARAGANGVELAAVVVIDGALVARRRF